MHNLRNQGVYKWAADTVQTPSSLWTFEFKIKEIRRSLNEVKHVIGRDCLIYFLLNEHFLQNVVVALHSSSSANYEKESHWINIDWKFFRFDLGKFIDI